jgi:hypothetical protein
MANTERDQDELNIEAANRRMQMTQQRGPVAVAARYDRRLKRVFVTLQSGLALAFRPVDVEGLEQATAQQLAVIEISPSGLGLYFPAIDADVYLPGLVAGAFGSAQWMAAKMGATGGQSRTPAKIAASRANGAKGGRPRKAGNV